MPPILPLTDAKIKSLSPKGKAYKVFDGQGLYIEVYPHGAKLWRIKYKLDGKEKRLSLGPYPEVSLKEARAKLAEYRAVLRSGKNPLEISKQAVSEAELNGKTFSEVADDWCNRFLVQTAPATIKKKNLFLDKHILPVVGKIPIKEITPPIILNKLMRPVEARGHLETAHRLKMIMGQIFRYAIATGDADRDPTQDLKGAVPPPKVKHRSTIIDPPKISMLLNDIYNYSGHVVVCHALKLLPLIFVRPGELRHAEWTEVDIDEALLRIPAEKMKMRTPHLVPLSRQSIEIIKLLQPVTGQHKFLFPGQRGKDRPMSDAAINAALRYLGYCGDDITGHGFRSMASTILNEQGYNRDWIERQLAHTERDGIRAAYNYAEYLPERRRMMQAWADYLDSLRLSR